MPAEAGATQAARCAAVLGFDTSGPHCTVALVLAGSGGMSLRATRCEEMGRGQAERLLPMAAEVLAEAGLRWSDLAAIGVGTGPGNFTGVRVAVAAARGLALGLGIPAIGVSGFEAHAAGQDGPVLVALPAPQGGVHLRCVTPQPELVRAAGSNAVSGDRDAAEAAAGDSPGNDTATTRPPHALPVTERPETTAMTVTAEGLAEALARIGAGGQDAAPLPVTGPEAGRIADASGWPVRAPRYPVAEAVARIAAARRAAPGPRPAPVYLRPADAAPPAGAAAPRILPDDAPAA